MWLEAYAGVGHNRGKQNLSGGNPFLHEWRIILPFLFSFLLQCSSICFYRSVAMKLCVLLWVKSFCSLISSRMLTDCYWMNGKSVHTLNVIEGFLFFYQIDFLQAIHIHHYVYLIKIHSVNTFSLKSPDYYNLIQLQKTRERQLFVFKGTNLLTSKVV